MLPFSWELEDFNISPILSAHCAPLRYRRIGVQSAGETEVKTSGEVLWVDERLDELERHMSTRYAIVYGHATSEEPVGPVLVFSRKLDGWSTKQKSSTIQSGRFCLVPVFSKSKATNGDQLLLTESESDSSWFRSAPKTRGFGKKASVPALRVAPAYGTSDDLIIDLLDLALERPLPVLAFNRVTVSWNLAHAFGLCTLFTPGQVVISLALSTHGSTGEVGYLNLFQTVYKNNDILKLIVILLFICKSDSHFSSSRQVVGIDRRRNIVSVRFYTNVGGSVDISRLRKQVQVQLNFVDRAQCFFTMFEFDAYLTLLRKSYISWHCYFCYYIVSKSEAYMALRSVALHHLGISSLNNLKISFNTFRFQLAHWYSSLEHS